MGKLAILLALALSTVAIYHGSASGRGLSDASRQAGEQQRFVLARSAAKSGWARAKQQLAGSFTGGVVTGANGTATYRTQMDVTGNEVVVTSVGSVPVAGSATPTRYTITYRLRKVGGDELPAFAKHAVAVNGNLSISGNGAIVTPGVAGPAGNELNVRVHANGTIHAGSSSTIVQGFGTYTGGATGKLASTFRPLSNPDSAPVLSRADSVRIPVIVPSKVVAAYGGVPTVYPYKPADYWDARLTGRLPGGSRTAPAVYYVRGNALIYDLTFDGYAVVVADGRVDLGGTTQGVAQAGHAESALAVFTPGEVTMNGGANVYGSLFAGRGLGFNGNVDIWGNLTVGGHFDHGGGATIHYRPATASLFRPWGTGDPALQLLAFREQ